MSAPLTITDADLRARLLERYSSAIWRAPVITNSTYHRATRGWVDKVFAPYFRDLLFALERSGWSREGNQCEHFAMRGVLAAVDCHAGTARKRGSRRGTITAESLAVGWIGYTQDTGGGHAINVWDLAEGLCEWEPQNQRWVTLSATERASAFHPIFL